MEFIYIYISVPTIGASPEDGVPDMTVISEIDEYGINTNLKTRYRNNKIYVRNHCKWEEGRDCGLYSAVNPWCN